MLKRDSSASAKRRAPYFGTAANLAGACPALPREVTLMRSHTDLVSAASREDFIMRTSVLVVWEIYT